MSRRSSRSSRRSTCTPITLITASSATNAIALPPKQLKSLGAAPCASSTATCKMIEWLRPHYAGEDGTLFLNVQAFVLESQGEKSSLIPALATTKGEATQAIICSHFHS